MNIKEPSNTLSSIVKKRDVFSMLLLGLIVIVVWVGMSVYFSLQKSTVEPQVKQYTAPLNPNIDRDTLQILRSRVRYTDQELSSFPINRHIRDVVGGNQQQETQFSELTSPSPTPAPVEQPATSPSPEATPLSSPTPPPGTTPEI